MYSCHDHSFLLRIISASNIIKRLCHVSRPCKTTTCSLNETVCYGVSTLGKAMKECDECDPMSVTQVSGV